MALCPGRNFNSTYQDVLGDALNSTSPSRKTTSLRHSRISAYYLWQLWLRHRHSCHHSYSCILGCLPRRPGPQNLRRKAACHVRGQTRLSFQLHSARAPKHSRVSPVVSRSPAAEWTVRSCIHGHCWADLERGKNSVYPWLQVCADTSCEESVFLDPFIHAQHRFCVHTCIASHTCDSNKCQWTYFAFVYVVHRDQFLATIVHTCNDYFSVSVCVRVYAATITHKDTKKKLKFPNWKPFIRMRKSIQKNNNSTAVSVHVSMLLQSRNGVTRDTSKQFQTHHFRLFAFTCMHIHFCMY